MPAPAPASTPTAGPAHTFPFASFAPWQARRVYVGNLPGSIPPQEVVDFFNDAMVKAGLNKWAGPPIVQAVHQSLEGGFVFIELRDVDETTALLMCGTPLTSASATAPQPQPRPCSCAAHPSATAPQPQRLP